MAAASWSMRTVTRFSRNSPTWPTIARATSSWWSGSRRLAPATVTSTAGGSQWRRCKPLGTAFAITTSTNDDTVPAVTAVPTVPTAGQYLVTWQTNQDIRARTVAGTETLGTLRTLANTGWGEYRPAAAGCESTHQFLVGVDVGSGESHRQR